MEQNLLLFENILVLLLLTQGKEAQTSMLQYLLELAWKYSSACSTARAPVPILDSAVFGQIKPRIDLYLSVQMLSSGRGQGT